MPEKIVHRAVADVMTPYFITCSPYASLADYQTDTIGRAAEIMLENKIGGVPVVDVNNTMVGVITDSDIFRAIVRQWRDDNLIFSGASRL